MASEWSICGCENSGPPNIAPGHISELSPDDGVRGSGNAAADGLRGVGECAVGERNDLSFDSSRVNPMASCTLESLLINRLHRRRVLGFAATTTRIHITQMQMAANTANNPKSVCGVASIDDIADESKGIVVASPVVKLV